MYTVASPDPDPNPRGRGELPDPDHDPNLRGGGQLPNPNKCNSTPTSGTGEEALTPNGSIK